MPQDATLGAETFMMYRNSNNPDDYVYTYTGRFEGDTKFKLAPKSELESNNFYYAGEGNEMLFGESDDNYFEIETEGYYTLNINVQEMTWSIDSYDAADAALWTILNFVGEFSSWGAVNEPNMIVSSYDPHQWSLDVELSTTLYGVKFRANNAWDDKWCPIDPAASPYGVAEYNPTDQDNNIDIESQGTGTYHVRFNDLTGHYYVTRKN